MAVDSALAFLRPGARVEAPVYLIAGPQPFLREYVMEKLRRSSASAGYRYRAFQVGGRDGFDAVIAELEGADLFAPKRLVVCRVLKTHRERTGNDNEGGEASDSRSAGKDEAALTGAIERIGVHVRLALLYERDNAPGKVRRVVEKAGAVINCTRPFDNQIGQYAESFARDLGLKLSFDAVELLAARHGADLGAIANALSKAAIDCADPGKVSASDLGQAGARRIPDLFELAESVARGRAGESLGLFERAIATGRDPIEMLAVEIIPLVRRMLIAAALLDQRKGAAEVARMLATAPTSPLVTRAIDGARRFGLDRLQRAHRRASVLDARFKNGLIREREAAISAMLLDLMGPATT